jgi:toxin ParE1/3/4
MPTTDPPPIRLRPAAASDLESIVKYFDAASNFAGDRFMQAYDSAVKLLAEHPGLGGIKRERGPLKGLRSWHITHFDSYLILYFKLGEVGIDVVRVLHGARNLDRELRKNGNGPER